MRRIASAERRFYAERVERAGKTREEELKMRLAAAREKLAAQQLLIKEQKVPVLVLLEGWERRERLLHRSDHREY